MTAPTFDTEYMRRLLNFQMVRFILVGGLNTSFSYAVYGALVFMGLNYVVANFCSLILGILFSFRTQGAFVFRNRDNRLIFRFAGFWFVLFLLNIGLITVLLRLGLNAYTAGAVALVPITLISYFVQKRLVFGVASAPEIVKSS